MSFSKLRHSHFRFRWRLVWMAPSGKTAPLPGPPNPSHSIHPNTKTKNFCIALNFFYGDLLATQGQEGLKQCSWSRRTHMSKTGSANLTTLLPEFWKTKTTFQLQFLVGSRGISWDLLSDLLSDLFLVGSIVRFPKGRLDVLKSFSKLRHTYFRFRLRLVWMAPSGKTAPFPGPLKKRYQNVNIYMSIT
jgi:hypothetical protein